MSEGKRAAEVKQKKQKRELKKKEELKKRQKQNLKWKGQRKKLLIYYTMKQMSKTYQEKE
ncbi:MAG: hypothetical protein ACR5KV_04070 [Wolbachia sp.]